MWSTLCPVCRAKDADNHTHECPSEKATPYLLHPNSPRQAHLDPLHGRGSGRVRVQLGQRAGVGLVPDEPLEVRPGYLKSIDNNMNWRISSGGRKYGFGGDVRCAFAQRLPALGRRQGLQTLSEFSPSSGIAGKRGLERERGRPAILFQHFSNPHAAAGALGRQWHQHCEAFADATWCSHAAMALPTQSNKTLCTLSHNHSHTSPSSLG